MLFSTLTPAFQEIRRYPNPQSEIDLEQIGQIPQTLLSQSPPLWTFAIGATRTAVQSGSRVSYSRRSCRQLPHRFARPCRPLISDFRGPRFQSSSPTHKPISSVCLPPTSVAATGSHFTYSGAPSTGAVTGFSYPAICSGCPGQYQVIQLSPHTPDASRRPQQPTSGDLVIPFRAPPNLDFHQFDNIRVYRVATVPVSTSPNLTRIVRIGSNQGISPRSARRSRTSPITGIRLRQRLAPA